MSANFARWSMKTSFFKPFWTLAILILSLSLAGCSGSVRGQVFLDSNGDGIHDTDETGVPYAKLSLTRDGKAIAEHYTDAEGYFDIPIKRSPGTVCISTDLSFAEANLDYIMYARNADSPAAAMRVSPPKAKAATLGEEEEEDLEEEEYEEESGTTVDTTDTTTSAQGWIEDKYCRDVKSRGFDVEIPVAMDFEAAISELPERLTVKCYAGSTCQVTIPYPDGCQLHTIYLPEGLAPAEPLQSSMSYNLSMNSLSFEEGAGEDGSKAFKALTTTRPTLAVSNFRIVTLDLAVSDEIDVGTTGVTLKPSAKCGDETLELPTIPIDLIREFDIDVYQNISVMGPYESGQLIYLTAGVENKGDASVSYGDLTITPPEGSVIVLDSSWPAGCLNNVKSAICRIPEIKGRSIEARTIKITLPAMESYSTGDVEEFTSNAKFFAPGMDDSAEAAEMKMDVTKGSSM